MALDKLRFHNIMVRDMDQPFEAAEELAEVIDEGMQDRAEQRDTDHRFSLMLAEVRAIRADMRAMQAEIYERITRMQLALVAAIGLVGATSIALLIALLARS